MGIYACNDCYKKFPVLKPRAPSIFCVAICEVCGEHHHCTFTDSVQREVASGDSTVKSQLESIALSAYANWRAKDTVEIPRAAWEKLQEMLHRAHDSRHTWEIPDRRLLEVKLRELAKLLAGEEKEKWPGITDEHLTGDLKPGELPTDGEEE